MERERAAAAISFQARSDQCITITTCHRAAGMCSALGQLYKLESREARRCASSLFPSSYRVRAKTPVVVVVMAIPPLSLLLLLVALGPTTPGSSLPSSLPLCRFDYTSLALLSYQETPPQLPTRSCCDALLFAVDIWPEGFGKGGVCCLCEYVVAKHPDFDLAGAYLACCGKDVDAVKMWRATDPAASNCDGNNNIY